MTAPLAGYLWSGESKKKHRKDQAWFERKISLFGAMANLLIVMKDSNAKKKKKTM